MAAPTVEKIRTGNLPHFQLTPKEATYLMAIVGFVNLVFGILIGFML